MNVFFVIIISVFQFNCSMPESKAKLDIEKYNIDVKFVFPEQLDIIVRMTGRIYKIQNELELLFNSESEIKSIKVKDKKDWIETSYKLKPNNIVQISIPQSLKFATNLEMRFEYVFPIKRPIEDSYYIDRGYRWYPLIIDDIAQVRMVAQIPAEFQMLSVGDLLDINSDGGYLHYTWETKLPVFKIPLVFIRPELYNKSSMQCSNTEISFYFSDTDKTSNEKILAETCNAFQFFDSSLSSYKHQQLTFIEMKDIQGSVIATGLILVGSNFIEQFRNNHYKGLHFPIATQWFGAGVFGKFKDDGFWFSSISLPHYLRLMYIEKLYGNNKFLEELEKPYNRYKEIADTEKDLPILSVDMINSQEIALVVFGKGPYVLHNLRSKMGDDNWRKFIKALSVDFNGKILTYNDFQNY